MLASAKPDGKNAPRDTTRVYSAAMCSRTSFAFGSVVAMDSIGISMSPSSCQRARALSQAASWLLSVRSLKVKELVAAIAASKHSRNAGDSSSLFGSSALAMDGGLAACDLHPRAERRVKHTPVYNAVFLLFHRKYA